jgi:SAM-dependent methyltransferase
MLKVNCGAGDYKLPGWTNVDADPAFAPDVLHDLSQGLPFADASVDFLHSEDFLSCLPDIGAVRTFLREAHRALKPEGTMRLLVPGLERLIEQYQHAPQALVAHWNRAVGLPLLPETAGMLVNQALKLNPGFFFDRPTLALLLEEAGFAWREVGYGDSVHPELRGIDLRKPDESVSLYLECEPR